MASFSGEIKRFSAKVAARTQIVFVNSCAHAQRSIQDGSPVTGSPGQPVADVGGGALRGSWQLVFWSPTQGVISTKLPYAESNEDGIARPGGGPYIQRAAIGGRWSVRLTIHGLPKIVEFETALAVGNG